MMHARYRLNYGHKFSYFAAVALIALFCTAVSAQGPQAAADSSSNPLMTYSEFERMASAAALQSGIPESLIADILSNFKETNDARIVVPQQWQSSILNLLYSRSVPYELAIHFLSKIPSKPVDTGYLDKLRSGRGTDRETGPIYILRDGVQHLKYPVVLYQPLPSYTDEARQARAEGIVLIQAIIRKDGSVAHPTILKGVGYGLDESAIDTLMTKWRFEPATLDGTPVSVQANIEISFKLY